MLALSCFHEAMGVAQQQADWSTVARLDVVKICLEDFADDAVNLLS